MSIGRNFALNSSQKSPIISEQDLISSIFAKFARISDFLSPQFHEHFLNFPLFSLTNLPLVISISSRYYLVELSIISLLMQCISFNLGRRFQNLLNHGFLLSKSFSEVSLVFVLPLSRIRAKPHLENVKFPETLILSDFHVSVVAAGFSLRAPESSKDFSENGGLANKNKLILFANPKVVAPLSIKDYTALVWFDHGGIAWVRLSRPSDWGFLACGEMTDFDDIINYRGKVYGVDRTGKVYAVNYDVEGVEGVNFSQSLRMECVVNDSILSGCDSDRRKRLVVDSSGVLYLVERVIVHFKVCKVNEEDSKLEEVTGLGGDRILFVGVDWCFFASAADLPGWKGDCIVFVEDSFPTYGDRIPSQEYCFKGTNKDLNFAVYHFEDGNARPISAFPGYSDLLWPPPAWFCPDLN